MGELSGRVGLVTGAAQGLGFAIASRFAREGARVAMADIQAEKVKASAQRLAEEGLDVMAFAVDVADSASVAAMVAAAVAAFGRLDMLVNVAGGSGGTIVDSILDMPDDVFDSVIARNLRGSFLCCRAAVPHLAKGGDGRILNLSSGAIRGQAGKSTIAAPLAYAAAKAGIHGLTNQLAKDLASLGIAVNVMQPGFVLTEKGARVRELFELLTDAERAEMLKAIKVPPREPEEVGWGVAWLMSGHAKGLTGTLVRLTGKLTGAALRLVPEGDSPFGPYARLEPDAADASRL